MSKGLVKQIEIKSKQTLNEFTALEYFEYVKSVKQEMDSQKITEFRNNAIELLRKFEKTKQIEAMKKLMFLINAAEKEHKIIEKGIKQYVHIEDIRKFINEVSSKVVKIIELERYPREIPDEVVAAYENVKDDFNRFYVVFTDYTGEIEKKALKKRKEKDPILFGAFFDEESQTFLDRMYYIGDWVDEHCDLTLEKLVAEMKKSDAKLQVVYDTNLSDTVENLRTELNSYTLLRGKYVKQEAPVKKSFFARVKTIFFE